MVFTLSPCSDYPCVQPTQTVRHAQAFQRIFSSSSAYQDIEVLHCDLVILITCFTATQACTPKCKLNNYFVSNFFSISLEPSSLSLTWLSVQYSLPSCSVSPKANSEICFNVFVSPNANALPFHL